MLSGTDIMVMQREAACRAARQKRAPMLCWPEDPALIRAGTMKRTIPFVGTYVAPGWSPVLDEDGEQVTYFVDSSGFGTRGEAALTLEEFADLMRPGLGYAVIEAGEFQVYVGLFERAPIDGVRA